MSAPSPGVYVGTLRHRRFLPVEHRFTYPLFMVLLDIDRIQELMETSSFTSCNRWNWAAFDDRDHLGDPHLPLRKRLASAAAAEGLDLPEGPVRLLTHLRYLGYCFNPISLFYCYDSQGALTLVLADVRNTFGGRRQYWLHSDGASPAFRASAQKSMYVSPFMEKALDYHFALGPVGDTLAAHIDVLDGGSRLFDATLTLARRAWSAAEIRRALFRHPFMTGHVIAGIHWEALRLWWKGVAVVPREAESRR